MQEDYVGKGRNIKQFPYNAPHLLDTINKKILSYPADQVLYITNRFLWEFIGHKKYLVSGLNQVSDHLFEKRRASCLSNSCLLEFLKEHQAKSLEIVGVDANFCVNQSVLSSIVKGFHVTVDLSCLGVAKKQRFRKTLQEWQQHQVIIKGEML